MNNLQQIKDKKEINDQKILKLYNSINAEQVNSTLLNNSIDDLRLKIEKNKEFAKTIRKDKINGVIFTLLAPVMIFSMGALVQLCFGVSMQISLLLLMSVCFTPLFATVGFEDYFKKKKFLKNNKIEELEKEIEEQTKQYNLTKDKKQELINQLEVLKVEQETVNQELEKDLKESICNDKTISNKVVQLLIQNPKLYEHIFPNENEDSKDLGKQKVKSMNLNSNN